MPSSLRCYAGTMRFDSRDVIAGVMGGAVLVVALHDQLIMATAVWLLCLLSYVYGRVVGASRHP